MMVNKTSTHLRKAAEGTKVVTKSRGRKNGV
jgi:hypothetical protein